MKKYDKKEYLLWKSFAEKTSPTKTNLLQPSHMEGK
jgi:hypothetical protein